MADPISGGADAAASGGGSSPVVDPISGAIKAGTEIAKTIASISDMNKRRKFEQTLSLLNNTQQRQLNEQLAATQDQNAKIEILSNSLTQYLIANANAGAKKDTALYIVAGGLAMVLLIVVVWFSIKTKKQ